ncbi:MAG: uroporphyrinogen decarboxylase family protein [bacterium]|nr:uroporphyrinogen decarboxylase family protein [bacterium]
MDQREKVLKALQGKSTGPVWLEVYINHQLASKLLNCEFTVDWGYNGLNIDEHLRPQNNKIKRWHKEIDNWFLLLKNLGIGAIGMNFWPPVFVEMREVSPGNFVESNGLIKSIDDFEYCTKQVPDPLVDSRYQLARELIERAHAKGFAIFFNSAFILEIVHRIIGFERFCVGLYEELEFLDSIFKWYCEYEVKLLRKLCSLKPDFLWISDDSAYKSGPYISPEQYRSIFLPYYRRLAKQITVPWILHSDGDITRIIPDMLTLGMNGLHPLEKDAVDLKNISAQYGKQVTLIGNLSVDMLQQATPEEVKFEVEAIRSITNGVRHIFSSGNSLVRQVKPENVWAMSEEIRLQMNSRSVNV